MYTDGNMHMSFDFGEEKKGVQQNQFYIFWWVQAFGLL